LILFSPEQLKKIKGAAMKAFIKVLLFILIIFQTYSLLQTKLEIGNKAPDFKLQDAFGNEYSLSSYFEKSPVVIYFYPAAGTSGCTKQACAIRDDKDKFEKNNIKVFGISTDTKEDIKKFIDDYELNFPLLSDADKIVSKEYGVLRENGSAKRVSFVIDMEGRIAEILEVKDIESHSDFVFNVASKLNKVEKDSD
jgi:peroxiredoxin Q/BCP